MRIFPMRYLTYPTTFVSVSSQRSHSYQSNTPKMLADRWATCSQYSHRARRAAAVNRRRCTLKRDQRTLTSFQARVSLAVLALKWQVQSSKKPSRGVRIKPLWIHHSHLIKITPLLIRPSLLVSAIIPRLETIMTQIDKVPHLYHFYYSQGLLFLKHGGTAMDARFPR